MTPNQKSNILYSILVGKTRCDVGEDTFFVGTPSLELLYKASELYDKTQYDNRFANWLTQKDTKRILIGHSLWSFESDDNLKQMGKVIEDLKVKLFESVLGNPKTHKDLRKRLRMTVAKQVEMTNRRHSLDHMTLEGYAESIKRRFIYLNTIEDVDGCRLWNNNNECNCMLLERIASIHMSKSLSVNQFREVARTDPWRGYWNSGKENSFGSKIFSEEGRSLVLFSKMYDNAYEHPECPNDDIIADDDMFDGWLIFQKRKREKEKMDAILKESPANKRMLGKKHAGELYTPAATQADANLIYNRNDIGGKMAQKQRASAIKAGGDKGVGDLSFQDVQMKVQQQSNQQFISTVKQGK